MVAVFDLGAIVHHPTVFSWFLVNFRDEKRSVMSIFDLSLLITLLLSLVGLWLNHKMRSISILANFVSILLDLLGV